MKQCLLCLYPHITAGVTTCTEDLGCTGEESSFQIKEGEKNFVSNLKGII